MRRPDCRRLKTVTANTNLQAAPLALATSAILSLIDNFVASVAEAGRWRLAAVYEYCFLAFAAFWGLALWGMATDATSWIDIAIIIVLGRIVVRLPDAPVWAPP